MDFDQCDEERPHSRWHQTDVKRIKTEELRQDISMIGSQKGYHIYAYVQGDKKTICGGQVAIENEKVGTRRKGSARN